MKEKGDIIFYEGEAGNGRIEVRLEEDTVWLTQVEMQELFQQTRQNIGLHIKNIFNEWELSREATIKDSSIVRKEGKRDVERKIEYYSLDVIISVGYRVKSQQGAKFRIWANKINLINLKN